MKSKNENSSNLATPGNPMSQKKFASLKKKPRKESFIFWRSLKNILKNGERVS